MKSVTVVSAFNRCNAGMYSVDLAAKQFLTGLGLRPRFVETQADSPDILRRRIGRHRTEIVRDPAELLARDALLYWGDFMNSPMYAVDDYRRRELRFGYSQTDAEALAVWKRLFMLSGARREGRRVIAVSGNFQTAGTAMAGMNSADRQEIAACLRGSFDAIYPRDPASTRDLLAAEPRAAGGRVTTGVDAAFLLRPERLFPWLPLMTPSRSFTYYFNRSKLENVETLLATLERETGLKAVRLRGWNNLHQPLADPEYAWMLGRLRRSAFVLTDTYHCAINTMNLGRPVICVGRPVERQAVTLSDYKKRVLFGMFGLSDSYVELPTADAAGPASERIVALARTRAAGDWAADEAYAELRRQVAAYRDLLTRSILAAAVPPAGEDAAARRLEDA